MQTILKTFALFIFLAPVLLRAEVPLSKPVNNVSENDQLKQRDSIASLLQQEAEITPVSEREIPGGTFSGQRRNAMQD